MKAKLFFVALILTAVFCITPTAKALTNAEISALVAQIQAQIAELMAQVAQLQAQQGTDTWCHTFNVNIKDGDSGPEVTALQTALTKEGFNVTGDPQGTFDDATASGVVGFQEKYAESILTPLGLAHGTGKVALATRTKLNSLYGCTTTCTPSWQTGTWTTCTSGTQTRTVTDSNNCNITTNKPIATQACAQGSCTDSDNGKEYAIKGTTSDTIETKEDSCYDSNTLKEYYCDSFADYILYTCPNGCEAGACKGVTTCTPSWQTGAWSTCVNNQQTRTVTDSNNCGVATGKPDVTQTCTSNCTPNWQTGAWSTCINSSQTRAVVDLSNCGITTNKPVTTQTCSSICVPTWTCDNWSVCADNQQSRTCTDSNNCGITTNKPAITQSCVLSPTSGVDLKINDLDGPLSISNNTINLSWTSSNNTYYCTASGVWSGTKATFGSAIIIVPISSSAVGTSSTFTLTCTGANGTATDSVVVNWTSAIATVDMNINGSTGTVKINSPFVLNWSATNVDSCTISTQCSNTNQKYYDTKIMNWVTVPDFCSLEASKDPSGTVSPVGSKVLSSFDYYDSVNASNNTSQYNNHLIISKGYTVSCTGPGGTASATVGATQPFGPIACTQNSDCGSTKSVCVREQQSQGIVCQYPTYGNDCVPAPQYPSYKYNLQTTTFYCSNPNTIYAQCSSQTNTSRLPGISCDTAGYLTCTSDWSCSAWSACINGQQSRTCTDKLNCAINCTKTNSCTIKGTKPTTTQSCTTTCTPSWQTGTWSTCTNGTQTRTVTDSNNCGLTTGKPVVTQTCTLACTPSWQTGTWSSCVSGSQSRTVTDLNNCGVTTDKPVVTQTCTSICTPSWQTGTWSACANGSQTRLVVDLSNCGITTNKPVTTQSCVAGCVLTDIYSEQVTGYVYSNMYIKANNLPSANGYKITGVSDSWNGTGFTVMTRNSDGSVVLKGDQTFNSTAVGYILARKSTIALTDLSNNIVCEPMGTTSTCTPSWQTGTWSTCTNGTQIRTVTDFNNCEIATNKPVTTQSCAPELLPSITSFTIKNVNGTEPTTWPYISPMYSLTVPYNTSATISWSSKNTTSCVAAGDWSGARALSGTESTGNIVSLATDEMKSGIVKKLYTLICGDNNGKTVKSSIIQIVSIEPNMYLRANSTPTKITVPYNTPVTLTWGAGPSRATNGQLFYPTSCNLGVRGYAGSSVSFSGSKSMGNITSNTTYTLGCLYPNNWIDAPKCNAGERCCTRQSSTSYDVNGALVTVEGENIYNCLESTNPSNGQYTVGKSINIDITIVKPTVDIKANNLDALVVPYNSTANITWATTGGVTSCTASGSWSGTKASSGSEKTGALNASPSSTKIYTITCTGPGGTVTDSVTVSVSAP